MLRASALGHASPLEHQVFAASSRKVIAHREAGLAAADYDRLNLFSHRPYPALRRQVWLKR